MKNFLKENWFKLSIVVVIVLIGVSIFYYFVIFIPHKERSKMEAENIKAEQQKRELETKNVKEQQVELEKRKAECQRLCDKRAIEDKEYWSGAMVFEAYCKYDFVSATCYFSGGGSTAKDNYWKRYIKNAETNQKLKVAWNADFVGENSELHLAQITDYWKEHKRIFGF